jgi:hypothetical protein
MPQESSLTSFGQWQAIVARHGESGRDPVRRNRTQQRTDVEWGMATISVDGLERPPAAPPLTMTVLDISAGGLMLRSFEPLKRGVGVGLALSLGDDEAWLQGYVMHCTPMLGGHKVGVELYFADRPASVAERAMR